MGFLFHPFSQPKATKRFLAGWSEKELAWTLALVRTSQGKNMAKTYISQRGYAYLVYRESWVVRCSKWLFVKRLDLWANSNAAFLWGNSYLLKLGACERWEHSSNRNRRLSGKRWFTRAPSSRTGDWQGKWQTAPTTACWGASLRAGKCISNRFNQKKIIWGDFWIWRPPDQNFMHQVHRGWALRRSI